MRTLDLQEAARFLRMHPETVRRMAVAGAIPSAKPGKSWIFIDVDLADWLRRQYSHCRQASQGEEVGQCHSTDAEKSGGCVLAPPMDSEYSDLLRLPTAGRLRNTKQSSRLRPGGSRS
ncbi:MAG: helix-turn-helix domain-containing protein [Gammaproteobacteria bacterium]